MNRYLLLILLSSWSLLVTYSFQCDTGVAFENSILSVERSLMANADVALLETYSAPTVERCMEECCSGKYGLCSVASFKKNSTKGNCLHFNCRPVNKCKFLSSPSTDSFTFSNNPQILHPVPSSHNTTLSPFISTNPTKPTDSKQNHQQLPAKEEIATFSEEQFAYKNDNTTIKPRKGVDELLPDAPQEKSGIKPRKGVIMEDVPHSKFLLTSLNKSNVKPRKGVGPYSSIVVISTSSVSDPTPTPSYFSGVTSVHNFSTSDHNLTDEFASEELMKALEKVFEDDTHIMATKSSIASKLFDTSTYVSLPTTSRSTSEALTSAEVHTTNYYDAIDPSYVSETLHSTSLAPSWSSTPTMEASFTRQLPVTTSVATDALPDMVSSSSAVISSTRQRLVVPTSALVLSRNEEEQALEESITSTDEETENERKYKSSMHLVLSLVFGLLVLFAVLGVVAKRIYDGWLRRDYYRMNYLIDGIYNGVD